MRLLNFSKTLAGFVLLLCSPALWAADKVTFQLDWLPGGDKAAVYVGIAKGFFADEGLEVEIAQGRGSTDAITKLATGRSDVGLADIGALLAARAESNVEVKAVMTVFSDAPHAFFTLEDSGINGVADIDGKRLASSPFTSSNMFLPLLLDMSGLPEDSVKLIKADPGALNPMLVNGATDAIIAWVTDIPKYRAQAEGAGKSIKVIPWYSAGLSIYSSSLIASETFIDERPDVAKRFVRAYKKSMDYTWANPEESGAAVHTAVPEVDALIAAETIKSIKSLVYNDISAKDGLGALEAKRLEKTWQIVAKAKGLDSAALDPEAAVSRQLLD
ncbi:ABC transporter substrate-binding protein [Microbulbifer sp. ALW1]|uniref:ABC transporter substrate-binding protein n=1 Tax=Microbulbifer sp. (strain ALW1) TaxID=1516059 RepID=UPI00135B08F7|nr:ABC transporter substrate-binding protein [Microbulbifer sp. ALW1]